MTSGDAPFGSPYGASPREQAGNRYRPADGCEEPADEPSFVSLFFGQGCAIPTYKEAVKLAKEYALSARLAFTKGGCRGLGHGKKVPELKLPNWMVAASRTSALPPALVKRD
jgi:hypothetical protein